jgi:hypothetical protein
MNTFTVLDLSTAHLPEEIAAGDHLCRVPGVLVVMRHQYGCLIYVPDSDDNWTDLDLCPLPVARILLYARDHGCQYIYLDGDGDIVPELPVWEW